MPDHHKPFAIALGCIIVFMIIYMVAGSIGWGLQAPNEQAIGEISRWCERVSAGAFREPSNALSNMGFMLAGLLMLRVLSKDSEYLLGLNQFFGFTPISILYASSVIWLGAGSMLMHGTHTRWGASADNLSMVMYILIPWLFNLSQMGGWSTRKLLIIYGLLVVTYGVGREFLGSRLGINLDLFDISIALWCISELLYRYWSPRFRFISGFSGFIVAAIFGISPIEMISQLDKYWWVILFWLPGLFSNFQPVAQRQYYPWFLFGMGTYFIAFTIWLTGRPSHPWCNPDSVFQAHALWHLLSALATWFFFKYFRTERGIRL
tara:strand:- start:837 stop:1796 length:960 start_codon:yes stop_codon:yes gene_type:complete